MTVYKMLDIVIHAWGDCFYQLGATESIEGTVTTEWYDNIMAQIESFKCHGLTENEIESLNEHVNDIVENFMEWG